jgi:hypothetical protein
MLLGQSVFQSVLTRLKEEQEDDEESGDTTPGFRISGLSSSFVPETVESPANLASQAEAYFAFLPEIDDIVPEPQVIQEPEPEAKIPDHLLRISPEEIEQELAITAADTAATLAEKRRLFAKANHPDGVAPEFRDNANTRMKTANLLIDSAIKQLYWRQS